MSGAPGKGTGQRPHTWITGTDPVRHDQYNAWLKARSQAHYRKESWSITFDQWVELWADSWPRRGRHTHSLMLMKRSWQEPWTCSNAELVDRETFHLRQGKIKQERKAMKNESEI